MNKLNKFLFSTLILVITSYFCTVVVYGAEPQWSTSKFEVFNAGWTAYMGIPETEGGKIPIVGQSTGNKWQALQVSTIGRNKIYIMSYEKDPGRLLYALDANTPIAKYLTEDQAKNISGLPSDFLWIISIDGTEYGANYGTITNVKYNVGLSNFKGGTWEGQIYTPPITHVRLIDIRESNSFGGRRISYRNQEPNAEVKFVDMNITKYPSKIDIGASFKINGNVTVPVTNSSIVNISAEIETEEGLKKILETTTNANNTASNFELDINTKNLKLLPEKTYRLNITAKWGQLSATQTVQLVTNKDTEAPKGIGKLQIINLGDKNFIANQTDYTKFLQEYSDNVTSKEKLKVSLAPNQDLESLVRNVGVSKFYVAIADEAGNVGNIEVPLFIKDDKVAFSNQNNFALRSNDIYINSLNYHQIETELSNFVRSKSEVKLWKLLPNQQGSLLNSNLVNINIINLPDKQIIPKSGDYIVPATYNVTGSTVTKNIKVSIADTPSALNIQFINEANQVLQGYSVIINTKVGDTLNLTRNEVVQTQLRKITNAGYEIAERPANETAVEINNTALTVQYKLQGVLSLTSVPNAIDFGSLTYDATTKRVEDPVFDKRLIVTDTRADAANGWRLTATLTTPMKNGNGQELVNALRYVTSGKETILNNNAQVVYTNSKGTAGSLDVSDSWGKAANTDGIKLQINSSDTVNTGDYVGVITWKVMAGQP